MSDIKKNPCNILIGNARNLTDYRIPQVRNQPKDPNMTSHEYRMWLQHNASSLMEEARNLMSPQQCADPSYKKDVKFQKLKYLQ